MWISKKKHALLRTRIDRLENIVEKMSDKLLKEREEKAPWTRVCPNGCETREVYHVLAPIAITTATKLQKVGKFLVCPECGEHFNPVPTLSLEELTLLAYGYTEIKEVE